VISSIGTNAYYQVDYTEVPVQFNHQDTSIPQVAAPIFGQQLQKLMITKSDHVIRHQMSGCSRSFLLVHKLSQRIAKQNSESYYSRGCSVSPSTIDVVGESDERAAILSSFYELHQFSNEVHILFLQTQESLLRIQTVK
jgi:hypothetical protein